MQNSLNQILRWRVNEVKNFVRENVSSCSLCQVENERFSWYCLSTKAKTCQKRKLVKLNPTKNQFLKKIFPKIRLSQNARTSQTRKLKN